MSKPVLLTVDDDPEVLNAIERDLRHHFRADYRVVKASSGAQALEAVRRAQAARRPGRALPGRRTHAAHDRHAVPARGDQALPRRAQGAPHRLRRHRDRHHGDQPGRARSLPDEALGAADGPALPGARGPAVGMVRPRAARVRGHPRGRQRRSRRRATRSRISSRRTRCRTSGSTWTTTRPCGSSCSAADGGATPSPDWCSFPTGAMLVQPSIRELAEKFGLQTRALQKFYDLIVVGGGPAGLAGAVYGASEGLRTILVEQSAPGGQAGTSSRIENYLGLSQRRQRRRPRAARGHPGQALRRRDHYGAGGGRDQARGSLPQGDPL